MLALWSIALRTLVAERGKFITALVGVVFSVVLVNVQGGLFLGLLRKASLLVDCGGADIWVGHRGMFNVDLAADIPRRWVYRVRSVPGVAVAQPYLLGHSTMTLPDGGFESVLVIGCERSTLLGNAWMMREGRAADVVRTDGIIVDAWEAVKLGDPQVGSLREIGRRRARVVGTSDGILGFLITPYVFTTLDRASEFLHKPSDVCSYVLVQLEPGADAHQVCHEIRRRLPKADAWPREVYSRMCVEYWIRRTGLGISFGCSTLLGLLVGMVIVAQTLYASVLDRIQEFGTLKAMGADHGQLYRMLLAQAVFMAALGSAGGVILVALIVGAFSTPVAPIVTPAWLVGASTVLVVVVCVLSSLLPFWRVRRVDPLLVLQS